MGQGRTGHGPVTVVVPYPSGGASDVLGRVFASFLAVQLGEPVIVDNRVGAGGTIGATHVAGSTPDGRTMLLTLGNLLLNQEFLLSGVKFRPLQALQPVAKTNDLRVAMVANANHPAKDLVDFIAMAKRNPGKHSFAYYGDLGIVSMAIEAGIDLIRVPYKGGPPGLVDVAAGNVDLIASSLTQALPLLKGGKLKILAVMTAKRWVDYPNVPTVVEILPRYKAVDYQGIFLPSGTPKPVVDALWKATAAVLANPDYRRSVEDRGAIPDPLGPEDFKRYVTADHANIKKIVEAAGIRAE
ncbi:tripartite tricarboxylate transporter substrate binding protein [Variovorax sp. J22R133]|uniref:Bug family tripartite tricarboxylate transporter substrate binding protein n=1 Tax=Variovorax brevis TaxID=3053503 RepID=UPI002577CFEA|nr:tripartite tricarboxylate transporter substrate binding protein [Variovorax sp. J22R133]MDM0116243.1 tripartite tricarboxylate transporter substrate binding protein [Variovorax sp. J22R133]